MDCQKEWDRKKEKKGGLWWGARDACQRVALETVRIFVSVGFGIGETQDKHQLRKKAWVMIPPTGHNNFRQTKPAFQTNPSGQKKHSNTHTGGGGN